MQPTKTLRALLVLSSLTAVGIGAAAIELVLGALALLVLVRSSRRVVFAEVA